LKAIKNAHDAFDNK
jgi:hypothetical protein